MVFTSIFIIAADFFFFSLAKNFSLWFFFLIIYLTGSHKNKWKFCGNIACLWHAVELLTMHLNLFVFFWSGFVTSFVWLYAFKIYILLPLHWRMTCKKICSSKFALKITIAVMYFCFLYIGEGFSFRNEKKKRK